MSILEKIGLNLLICVFMASSSWAQDARFNQFYAAPQYLNPAMTGIFQGQLRFNANFRDQWSSILGSNPYRTIHAGVDMRFPSLGKDYFALGINSMLDQSGHGHFKNSQVMLSGAYLKQIGAAYSNGAQYLVAGGQAGIGQYTVDWGRLWFSDQYIDALGVPDWINATGDPSISGGSVATDLFVDVNAGLMWYAIFEDDLSVYFGAAMNHLTRPNISLIGDQIDLEPRIVIHGGGEFPLVQGLSILPAFNFMKQGNITSTTIGFNFRYTNRDWREVAIRAGLWPHFSRKLENKSHLDETAFTFILEMSKWNVGISYGLNTSSLKAATNARGALEVSLIYVLPSKARSKQQPCPKF